MRVCFLEQRGIENVYNRLSTSHVIQKQMLYFMPKDMHAMSKDVHAMSKS
jgi:hypothetical protein